MEKEFYSTFNCFVNKEGLDSPGLPGSGINMDYNFMVKLRALSDLLGYKLKINSGFRTPEYNDRLIREGYPAVKDSAHILGLAADIETIGGNARYNLIEKAIFLKIPRIGVAKNFVHLDIDSTKPKSIYSY